MTVILGLNAFHADASAVICVDGSIVCASEEERFSRIKHESGFPYRSISWCLKNAGLKISEIDHIAINSNPKAHLRKKIKYVITKKPNLKFVFERFQNKRNRSNIKNIIETFYHAEIINAKFHFIEHHLAHLASAFYASPFDTSSILSIDGFGDFASAAWGLGDKTKINIHQKVYFPHSMGVFYTSITQFLGFPNYGDEYKVMGLAPYGKPKYIEEMRKLVLLQNNGTYKLNLKYFDHTTKHIPIKWNGGSPILGKHYSDALKDLLGEPRSSKSELLQRHMDIAHSAQLMYEEALFHILNKVYENYPKEKNLCIAGGCGANSVANGKITKKTKFENVYVQAAAGDAGGALGSLIPPSNLMIIYGIVAEQSIPRLFLAGFIPGILATMVLMITTYIIAKRRNYVGDGIPFTWPRVGEAFYQGIWALIAPIVILGGISNKNIRLVRLTNSVGFAGISIFQ